MTDPTKFVEAILRNQKLGDAGSAIGGILYSLYSYFKKDGFNDNDAILKAAQFFAIYQKVSDIFVTKNIKPDNKNEQ